MRPEPLALGDHYAQRRVLPADPGGRYRICLLGESVAAGYLYAPALTPAAELERQLRVVSGSDGYEVIDLARTNERLAPLVETMERALQLAPDLFVVFAGNNCNLLETPEVSQYFPSIQGRLDYARALVEGGVGGAVDLARRRLRERLATSLARLQGIAAAAGVPVVVVVPETNLADWESRQPVTWLPADGTRRWYELLESTSRHLRAGDHSRAVESAWEMIDLDGSACSTSCRLLAEAYRGLGDQRRARVACLGEVDSEQYATLGFLGAPRATSDVREVLRKGAERFGLSIVDLPAVFERHSGTPLPGRRYFLDYCHLTSEGIQVAMSAIAAKVLRLSAADWDVADWQALLPRVGAPPITPEADATAKLGAAIHTAHRQLPVTSGDALLTHWCREAMRASAGVVEAMLDYAAARVASAPTVVTGAELRNHESPYRLQHQHGWRYEYLDARMLAAIRTSLEEVAPGRAAEVARLVERCAPGPDGLELASPARFAWEPLARFYPEVMEQRETARGATYRSPWPRSAFALPARAGQSFRLDLVGRLPGPSAGSPGRPVTVAVNGRRLATVVLGAGWSRASLRIGAGSVKAGLNRISVEWPMLEMAGDDRLGRAIRRLECGIEADLHPVFGEIASLRARAV